MLITRVLSALVMLPVALALVLFAPELTLLLVTAAIFLAGAWEWGRFLRPAGPLARAGYVLALGLLMAAVWWGWAVAGQGERLMQLAAVFWLLVFALLASSRFPTGRVAAAVAGALTLVPGWLALNLLAVERGRWLLLLALFLVWAADVGAYFAGKGLGRHKLAPIISPKKTWEGVAGGALLALAVAAVGAQLLEQPVTIGWLLAALVAALISICGDLQVSAFKRGCQLKDSGDLIPGHGGILDRADSITAALPVFAVALTLAGY